MSLAVWSGVWKREKEEDPPGTLADDTTTVYWVQSPSGHYVDIRIPKESRPGDGSAPSLSQLAAQKSFAGMLTAEANITTWNRHIDFHPPTGGKDMGENDLKGSVLTEVGYPDHDYLEVWHNLVYGGEGEDPLGRPGLAMDLTSSPEGRTGVFVVVGNWLAVALGRPTKGVPADELAVSEKVTSTTAPSFEALLTSEGFSDDQRTTAVTSYQSLVAVAAAPSSPFIIQHSTLPALEGTAYDTSKLILPADGLAEGRVVTADDGSEWTVAYVSASFDPACLTTGTSADKK